MTKRRAGGRRAGGRRAGGRRPAGVGGNDRSKGQKQEVGRKNSKKVETTGILKDDKSKWNKRSKRSMGITWKVWMIKAPAFPCHRPPSRLPHSAVPTHPSVFSPAVSLNPGGVKTKPKTRKPQTATGIPGPKETTSQPRRRKKKAANRPVPLSPSPTTPQTPSR
jgi:hypothetical protein